MQVRFITCVATIAGASDVAAQSLARLHDLITTQWNAGEEVLNKLDTILQSAGGIRVPLEPGVRRRLELESASFHIGDISYDRRHSVPSLQATNNMVWNISAARVAPLQPDKAGRLPFLAFHDGQVSFLGTKEDYDPIALKGDFFASDYFGNRIHVVGSVGRTIEVVKVAPVKGGFNVTRQNFEIPEGDEVTALEYARPLIALGDATGHLVVASIEESATPQFITRVKLANSPILQLKAKNAKEVYVLTETSLGLFNVNKNDFSTAPCTIPPSRAIVADGNGNIYLATRGGPIAQISVGKCRIEQHFPSLHAHASSTKIVTVGGKPNMLIVSSGKRVMVFLNRKPIMSLDLPIVHMARVRSTQSLPVLSLTTTDPVTRYDVPLSFEHVAEDNSDGVVGWILYFLETVPRPVIIGGIFVAVLFYNIRKVKKKYHDKTL
eukprot:GEMP01058236.1.p1 GENE.GEMP01058236.1~~GEMP01058236.1.p1  ORF type:complete len:437 (+),score=84.50 GEMP01058236.1:106-1416(+)